MAQGQNAAQSVLSVPLPTKQQAGYVMAMTRDGRGDIWVGTEDQGVWRFDALNGKWINYQIKDGLGDNNGYALTVDKMGRVWVGHLNHGVSVWNGEKWRNYNVLEGPLGERVFALATSPFDGDVWLATNAGLSRYQMQSGKWRHTTKADGLPTHEISALSFDSIGNLYVGTQTHGLVKARSDDDYATWENTRGSADFPAVAAGAGLPSDQINDVLVADNDIVYVATTNGLARSTDYGQSWTFIRGMDWQQKLEGLYEKRAPTSTDFPANRLPLSEDYVTNIAEDGLGLLWISYRQKGYEIRRPLEDHVAFSSPQGDDKTYPYVSALLPLGDGTGLVGTYNGGLAKSEDVPAFTPTPAERQLVEQRHNWGQIVVPTGPAVRVAFPTPATAPDLEELKALIARLQNVPVLDDSKPLVETLDEDWITQGDWLGRYGRYNAVLAAMVSPGNLHWGAGNHPLQYRLQIDPREKGNALRYWVHWLQTDNRRALEMPPLYFQSRLKLGLTDGDNYRRQSEVDDNGESYPLTKEGPDIYATVRIPKGLYYLSFYNHNKDGHDDQNRMRDYRYSVRHHSPTLPLSDVSRFDSRHELAVSRQRDFWGGVYKRFLVSGPQELTIKIAKNNSFNTILAGMFLDLVDEEPPPYFISFDDWQARENSKTQQRREQATSVSAPDAKKIVEPTTEAQAAEQLWAKLEEVRAANPAWWASERRRFYIPLVKWLEASRSQTTTEQWPTMLQRISASYYYASLFEPWEKAQKQRGLTPARDVELSLVWDGKSDSDLGTDLTEVAAFNARPKTENKP